MTEKPRIALQLMTVKDYVAQHGIISTLEKMKECGISYAEMSKIPPNDQLFLDIAKAQKDLDVHVIAYTGQVDVPIAECYTPRPGGEYLDTDYDSIVRHARTIGAEYIRANMMPRSMRNGRDSFLRLLDKMNGYARRLHEEGFKYYFHTHHFEFSRYDGEYWFDLLLNNTDPDYVGIELDVHWAHRGGVDELAMTERIRNRCELYHIKDLRISNQRTIKPAIGMDRFSNIQYAEIGEGNLDFTSIIPKAVDCGAKYFVIEQDETYERNSFDSVALSVANIRKMGFGDML